MYNADPIRDNFYFRGAGERLSLHANSHVMQRP